MCLYSVYNIIIQIIFLVFRFSVEITQKKKKKRKEIQTVSGEEKRISNKQKTMDMDQFKINISNKNNEMSHKCYMYIEKNELSGKQEEKKKRMRRTKRKK